jgi:hypothetical protein
MSHGFILHRGPPFVVPLIAHGELITVNHIAVESGCWWVAMFDVQPIIASVETPLHSCHDVSCWQFPLPSILQASKFKISDTT